MKAPAPKKLSLIEDVYLDANKKCKENRLLDFSILLSVRMIELVPDFVV